MVATTDASMRNAPTVPEAKKPAIFHYLHPRELVWHPLVFALDMLWRVLVYAVGAVIVGGVLVNIVVSLLTTGSIGLTNPSTWPLMQPIIAHPNQATGVLADAALLVLCAFLAHRISKKAPFPSNLRFQYNLEGVA